MTSKRPFFQADNRFGGSRSSRSILDSREGGFTAAQSLSSMSRWHVNALGNSFEERVSRGKAIVYDDRLGRDGRVSEYPHRSSRGSDHAEASGYRSTERRFRDENGPMRVIRSDDATRGEVHRYGDVGVGGRIERNSYKSEYPDEPRWVRTGGKYGSLNNYDGITGLRGSSSEYIASVSNGSRDFLPGFIYEGSRRTALDWTLRSSSGLAVEDRRLSGQPGHGTRVFLFDLDSRELYGVFQCVGDAVPAADLVGHSQVRIRVVKECFPLLEREFREIIRDNYFTNTRFTIGLRKEQVDKLLQIFRPMGRNAHLPLSSSRSSLQDFHGVTDDFPYGKEERRAQAPETTSFSTHRYHGKGGERFSSKSPHQVRSERKMEADEYEHMSHGSPVTSFRSNQHSLRGLSGSRIAAPDQVNSGKHSELRLADGDWREQDQTDAVHRKRHIADELRRSTHSSTAWKDSRHSRAQATGVDVYDRVGRVGVKDDSHGLTTLRHGRNEIDLNNIPLDMGHGEPFSPHVRDVDSKIAQRRVVVEDDVKWDPASTSKGRSLPSRGSDYAAGSRTRDELEDMSLTFLEDHSYRRRQERTRASPVPASSGFANGNALRVVTVPFAGSKSITRDNPSHTSQLRRESDSAREVVLSSRDSSTRTSNFPMFSIKASLQAPSGRGKPERIVTLVNSAKPRPRFHPNDDNDDNHQSWRGPNLDNSEGGGQRSESRKRKMSVFSRLSSVPSKPSIKRTPVPLGKGPVFTRLGPALNTSEAGESDFPRKRVRMFPHPNLVWRRKGEAVAETEEADTDQNSVEVDAHDDSMVDNGTASSDHASEEPQGWSRKKSQIMSGSSGDEGGNLEAAERGKSGRRKIVRPPIEGKSEERVLRVNITPATAESDREARLQEIVTRAVGEQDSPAQQGSPAAMDIEMTAPDTKEGTIDLPKSVSEVQEMASNSAIEESRNLGAENMVS
ncbi:hypothetical protein R1flu_019034 [Riccia fluitans]|uniref:DCD domain-containing protein n=1 Tax=Riccia fluitans TaxID=41844 RepID=A0ABD1ZJ26_9MARC